jgi:methyl-accepting chemotaxis protein
MSDAVTTLPMILSAAADEVATSASRASDASRMAMELTDGGRKQVLLTRETIDQLSDKLNATTTTRFQM